MREIDVLLPEIVEGYLSERIIAGACAERDSGSEASEVVRKNRGGTAKRDLKAAGEEFPFGRQV